MLFPLYDENPTRRAPIVTVSIILINAAALLYTFVLSNSPDQLKLRRFFYDHGFVPARIAQLSHGRPLEVNLFPEPEFRRLVVDRFGRRAWLVMPSPAVKMVIPPSWKATILAAFTAMFLHGGLVHFLGNMWFLWLFGNNIEDRLGHLSFLLFYLLGGLAATAAHCLMITPDGMVQPIIGASGAVAVVLGAYAVTFPSTRVHSLLLIVFYFTVVDLPALVVLGFWFVIQFFNGIHALRFPVGNPVAWWAHIGGFLVGAAVMPWLAPRLLASPRSDTGVRLEL